MYKPHSRKADDLPNKASIRDIKADFINLYTCSFNVRLDLSTHKN